MMLKLSGMFFGMWLFAVSAHAEGGTAYLALKAAQKDTDSSASLLEVTGERGEPQPQEWKVVLRDPEARGGVREIVASGDVVVSRRTPLRGYSDLSSQSTIVLTRLNLDSDRAFQIANKQAVAQKLGFSWVDYTLRANAVGGSPMWVLRLYDKMGTQVGVTQISAENGSVIMPLQLGAPAPSEPTEQFSDSSTGRTVGGVIGRVGGTIGGIANGVKNTTLRTVGSVQEFFTGDRTIGPRDEDDQ
ncbi:MAG TPA: hypothetical protein VIS99_06440 [Terrimicrobiaceae bacterium]